MTRRTPAEVLSNYAASLSINDHASPTASEKKPAPLSPVITYKPTYPRATSSSFSSTSSGMTQATTDSDDSISAACKPEDYIKPFCDFLTENPTVFHAVDYFKKKLNSAGYKELSARDNWNGVVRPGGKYFITRNGSSLIAFKVGKAYKPGNGIGMVCGHVDAVTAKLKPCSRKPAKAGYNQLGVAPYSSSLNETWWDRDLSIGGRVVVTDTETGVTSTKLVKIDWPVAKIPTLAVHFGKGLLGQQNKETQAVPIVGLDTTHTAEAEEALGLEGSFINGQPAKLVRLIAKQLGITDFNAIKDWELELYDSQPAQLIGFDRDMISAGRIDDKLCSWPAIISLIASEDKPEDSYIKLVGVFDDEEVGSRLRQGAASNFIPTVVERSLEALSGGPPGAGVLGQTYARSFVVSADVSHAGNPNFLEQYLPDHIPKLNTGIVIAADSNGHFITDSVSTTILKRVAEITGSKTQPFMIRNDSRSGGTIGPYLACLMGIRGADAGMPQLSMHSIRATTGSQDPGLAVQFFKGFLDNWEKLDNEWEY